MLFNPQLSWGSLALLCRSLGTMLQSGVPLIKAMQVAGGKSRDPKLRSASEGIASALRKGTDVSSAMRGQDQRFPELVVDMVDVAEQTGSLPEVLLGLADHYENLIRLRRTFLGAIAWPMFQLLAAIFIIAGLMVLMGWLDDLGKGMKLNLFFGLKGTGGALLWLGGWVMLAAGGTSAIRWRAAASVRWRRCIGFCCGFPWWDGVRVPSRRPVSPGRLR